jgi:signal transduction histidine kinase
MNTFFSRRDGASGNQKLSSNASIGHFYLDSHTRQVYCLNEAARQMVHQGIPITREDLQRQPLQTLAGTEVTPNDLPLQRAWRENKPQEATFVVTQQGGMVQHLTWSAAPLAGPDGDSIAVVATAMLAPPEPDWQELAGLAHDLRTPLQAIRLLIPLIENMPLVHGEARELLERLRASSDRALSVGMDLLDWCRGPTLKSRRLQSSWFPLAPFLTQLMAEQVASAQRKGLALTPDLADAEGLEVQTDKARLGRLLSNLLANAIRYTLAGAVRVRANWRLDDNGQRVALALTVQDTGEGISTEDQESIFQPFERGKAGKESDKAGKESDSGGSGVGLAVVDRLLQELNLTLEVFSEYGHGSTFDLLLPLTMLRPAEGPSAGV